MTGHRSRVAVEDGNGEGLAMLGPFGPFLTAITKLGLSGVGVFLIYWMTIGGGGQNIREVLTEIRAMRGEHVTLGFYLRQSCINSAKLAGEDPRACDPPR